MRTMLQDVKVGRNGIQVVIEIRYRQGSWLKRVWVPFKYLAIDEVVDALNTYRVARHLPHRDDIAPPLPLEKWE